MVTDFFTDSKKTPLEDTFRTYHALKCNLNMCHSNQDFSKARNRGDEDGKYRQDSLIC